MGHWEQIGQENREERARRAALPWWRRAIRTHVEAAIVASSWIFAGLLIWMMLRGG